MSERQEPPRWSLATRIAFRFLFCYLTLYILFPRLASQNILREAYFDFWDAVVVWADEAIVHLPYELTFDERGISSSPYGWVQFLCSVALAGVATVVWSMLDRRRLQYARLYPWLRIAVRYALALTMIRYGAIKVIPSQMIAPPPPLGVIQQRIGDIFPNHLLWWTVGASPTFETATGLAELLGGVLLLLPRTTLLGALISTANMLLVFLLNMCYDVPVKMPSLHFLVMGIILVAPDVPRLVDVFLFHRRTEPSRVPPFFQRKWLDRIPHTLLFLFGLLSIKSGLELAAERHARFHPPRPPLYGIWSVEVFAHDGKDVPLYTKPDRWRLVTFQKPGSLRIEQMDGSWKSYGLDLDLEKKKMTLDPAQATLSFHRPEKDVLILDGPLEGRRMRARLRKMPLIRKTT